MADTTDRIHIDENDPKLQGIETDRKNEIADVTNTFNGMISERDALTGQQIEAVKQNEQTQIKNQNDLTDFTLEKIAQDKQLAEKDFQKEQSAAYVDFQKESNRFGVNAEKMAQNGFFSSGYSESSQVAMYNQYQNRVAVAREGFNKAVMNYNNQMTEARLQNNVLLAEITSKSLEEQLMIAMQGFQDKNQLLGQLISQKNVVNQRYDSLWQSTYNNMLEEARLNESARQFDTTEENDEEAQAKADAQALCKSLAAIGKMPTEEQLAAAGYTVEDIQPFIDKYNQDQADEDKASARAEIENIIKNGGTLVGGNISEELLTKSGWSEADVQLLIDNHAEGEFEAGKPAALELVMALIASGGTPSAEQIAAAGLTQADVDVFIADYEKGDFEEGRATAQAEIMTFINAGGTIENGQITEEMLKAAGWTEAQVKQLIDNHANIDTEKEENDARAAADAKIEQLLSLGIRPKDDLIADSSWTPEEIDEILKKTTVAGSTSDSEWTDFDGNPVDAEPESFDYSLLSDVCGAVSNYEDSAEALNKLGLIKPYVDGETGKFKLNFSAWALVDDGGTYSGKLNDNMKVKSPDGKTYSISELYEKLKDVMGTKAAKELLVKLQGYIKTNPVPKTGESGTSASSTNGLNSMITNPSVTLK